jgi:hypothetical protein
VRNQTRRCALAVSVPVVAGALIVLSLGTQGVAVVMTNEPVQKADGYRGIWYNGLRQNDQYRYVYSGGLGTYPSNMVPMAWYAPAVRKTFFVYGGTKGLAEKRPLLEMVSYYDHETGMVARPTIVFEKGTADAHHNPTLCLDPDGFVWIFMSSHGKTDGFIYRSRAPYSIDAFDRIEQHEFTYPEPWAIPGFGFLLLYTKYTAGRELYWRASRDGITWSEDRKLAGFGGHYQISWARAGKCATAFNYHPVAGGSLARTNLYYVETTDWGKTWRSAAGEPLGVPLDSVRNAALVHDYQAEGLLVYLVDINLDHENNPVILYVLSKGYESGPKNDPRVWTTARWTGSEWDIRPAFRSDHNYDVGSLYIEDDGTWRIIAPTEPGPQPYCCGGDIAMWVSRDRGETWRKTRVMTRNGPRNHTYVRRPLNAHPDFYAFWADGNALRPSGSRLYFANKAGDVYVLPYVMSKPFARPRLLAVREAKR